MQEIAVYDLDGNTLTNLVQYDTDVYIHIKDSRITAAYQVQFFNSTSESALVMNSTYSNGVLSVKIPNNLLVQPYTITGYVNVKKSGESKCLYAFRIAVRKKPIPNDWVHIDSKDYVTFEEIVEECRNFAENASISATNAKASEIAASNSATNAKNSETNAANSAAAALVSENNAKASETASATSETNAKISETNAKTSEQNSKTSETNAGTSEQNAKTYSNNAKASEDNAKVSENNAKISETNSATSESNSKTSEINAKASADSASTDAERAETAREDVEKYADLSKSYAVGTDNEVRANDKTDNAKYYYEQSKQISAGLSGALLPMGTISFADLSIQTKMAGYMFNISDTFITDETFKEGAGFSYPPGTNVYYTADGYWDCLAGTLVTGVKGNKETDYRIGNVNLTPENIGAQSIEDAETMQDDIDNIKTDIDNYVESLLDTIKSLQDTVLSLENMIYTGEVVACIIDDEEDNIITDDGFNICAWWKL